MTDLAFPMIAVVNRWIRNAEEKQEMAAIKSPTVYETSSKELLLTGSELVQLVEAIKNRPEYTLSVEGGEHQGYRVTIRVSVSITWQDTSTGKNASPSFTATVHMGQYGYTEGANDFERGGAL